MFHYIALLRFTDQGAKNIKQSASRAHSFDEAAEKAGVKIDGQYWTVGAYDGVLILSADEENKVLHWLAELATAGNVRTETMRSFTEKEFVSIVAD
ncbi:MAG: hypothetical protein QOE70_6491 [Chthoniobacter sp.]|jgi:uncharacterized protein with GYD domain|nr:hypothetical protein [Chthoniobacter sp.]